MSSSGATNKTPSIHPGATISGRFRVERLLGQGSMGAVWLARHLALDVDVAVKFIDAALRDEQEHRKRFVHEAQSAARINSRHVVNVLDFGEDEGRLYIAMEYLVGENLSSVLERSQQLPLDVTARVVEHTCRGLSKAHALGIAHRDIKPENLFLCGEAEEEAFVLKILDFGVAKTNDATSVNGTQAGQLIGSPAFMSPEQARSLPQIDGRSDLFSLAVVAYYCLTGAHPFGGQSLGEMLFGIIGGEAPPVSKRVRGLPTALDGWFATALEKEPKRRFQSAKEMSQAFLVAVGRDASPVTSIVGPRSGEPSVAGEAAPADSGSVNFRSGPRLSLPQVLKLNASNRTSELGVAPALAQLGEAPHVLGVALVSPELVTVAHHSADGMTAAAMGQVAVHLVEALGPFESLESSQNQLLGLHYESACVLVRWLDGYLLLVVGSRQAQSTVLTVTLNTVASKLHQLARQAGGVAAAFALSRSSGVHSGSDSATVLTEASSVAVGEASPAAAPRKKVVIYRGNKMEVDE